MAKLLQNKVVVSCLVATAALGITANFVKLKLPGTTAVQVSARAVDSIGPDETFEPPPPLSIADELVSWRKSAPQIPKRDPFAWIDGPSVASISSPAAPSFRLQA